MLLSLQHGVPCVMTDTAASQWGNTLTQPSLNDVPFIHTDDAGEFAAVCFSLVLVGVRFVYFVLFCRLSLNF